MSLNPSTQSNSAVDVIDGTVSEFYNLMDQCIRKSEVMPGQYKSITSPSYSNNCPIYESSFTTIDVGCPAPQVVDINNSFITAKVKVPITFGAGLQAHNNVNTFFVGWRSSLDALQRYIIYCNHKVVYDQVYVGEESFVLQSLIPEHVRCRRPNQYTTYENASTFSPDVCGTYITLNPTDNNSTEAAPVALGATTVEVQIPIKIDISQFLLFQNFKYLPGFCGTWSIKLYPSSQYLNDYKAEHWNSIVKTEQDYHRLMDEVPVFYGAAIEVANELNQAPTVLHLSQTLQRLENDEGKLAQLTNLQNERNELKRAMIEKDTQIAQLNDKIEKDQVWYRAKCQEAEEKQKNNQSGV